MKKISLLFGFVKAHKKIAAAVVLLTLVVIFKPFGILGGAKAASSYKTETASRKDLSTVINASGQVEASDSATMSFLTTGRVVALNFQEGDKVKEGQVIAALDETSALAEVAKAQATYQSAQAALNKVLDDIHLSQYGAGGFANVGSANETATQKADREEAEMTRDEDYQALVQAQKVLDSVTIMAPFDGVVSNVTGIAVGQNISAMSGASVTVINPDVLKFVANVDETDFGQLSSGMEGDVSLDAYPDETFKGTISRIGVAAVKMDTGGSVVPVDLSLPSDSRIKDNLTGEADFNVTAKKGVIVISRSTIHKNNGSFVYLLVNGKPVRREITVGETLGSQAEITGGLSVGDQVILGDVAQ